MIVPQLLTVTLRALLPAMLPLLPPVSFLSFDPPRSLVLPAFPVIILLTLQVNLALLPFLIKACRRFFHLVVITVPPAPPFPVLVRPSQPVLLHLRSLAAHPSVSFAFSSLHLLIALLLVTLVEVAFGS